MADKIPISLTLDDRDFLLKARRAINSLPSKKSIEIDSAPLKRITGDFNQFNKSLDAAVARVISFTATTRLLQGFGNSIGVITKSAIEVEHAMARIGVILGTTENQTKSLKKTLFELANSTSSNFYDAAQAAEEFSRQGLGIVKTLEATKAAMVLAKLSGTELKSTIEGITAVMATSANQALDFVEVADKIAAVDAKFATSAAGLLDGLKRFGGVAEQNGLVLDKQLALLASVKQLTGRSEAVVGNSIKSILVSFGNQNVQKELEAIGVSVKDSEGNFKDLIEVGRELSTVFDTLTDSQKAFVQLKVAGKYQSNAFDAFIRSFKQQNDGSASLIDQAIATAENSKGSSLSRIDTLNKTTKSQLEVFNNTLTKFGDAVGSKLTQPIVNEFVQMVGQIDAVFSSNTDVQSIGEKLGNGILTGIRNVVTQPGLVVGGVLIANLIKKIGGDALKATGSILGISKYKRDIAAIEQVQVSTILPKISEYDLKRIAALNTQYDRERAILAILNAQLRVREAGAQASQFLNRVPGITASNRTFVRPPTKAGGSLPDAFIKESIDINNGVGGATAHAKPKQMLLNVGRGVEPVIVNSDEKIIRNFAGTGQDAVINREMMGYASGSLPNLSGGLISSTKKLFSIMGKRNAGLYTSPHFTANDASYSAQDNEIYLPSKRSLGFNRIPTLFHEAGHLLDRKNILSEFSSDSYYKRRSTEDRIAARKKGYKDIDYSKIADRQEAHSLLNDPSRILASERRANINVVKLFNKTGLNPEKRKEIFTEILNNSYRPYFRRTLAKPGVLKNISGGHFPTFTKNYGLPGLIGYLGKKGKIFPNIIFNYSTRLKRDAAMIHRSSDLLSKLPSMGPANQQLPISVSAPSTYLTSSVDKKLLPRYVNNTYSLGSAASTLKYINSPKSNPKPSNPSSNFSFKGVIIDSFSDSGVQSSIKQRFLSKFGDGLRSTIKNAFGGGKFGQSVSNLPGILKDTAGSLLRPNSYIPTSSFYQRNSKGKFNTLSNLSKLSDENIDRLMPFGNPSAIKNKEAANLVSEKNEQYKQSIRERKAKNEQRRSQRSARLAGGGFAASFFGGAASELFTSADGSSTGTSRSISGATQSLGLTAAIASINPMVGAAIGAGLLIKEGSNIVNEIFSGAEFDRASKSYKQLTDSIAKSESILNNYTEAAISFNDALSSGNTLQLEQASKNLNNIYSKLPENISRRLGGLNLSSSQDLASLQGFLEQNKISNQRSVAQAEFEKVVATYKKEGFFGQNRNTSLLNYANRGTFAADQFVNSVFDGTELSSIPQEIKDRIRNSDKEQIDILELLNFAPESGFKDYIKNNLSQVGSYSPVATSANDFFRRLVLSEDAIKKQVESAKKSYSLSSYLRYNIDNGSFKGRESSTLLDNNIDFVSQKLSLNSDTLTDFGRSLIESKLSVEKLKSQISSSFITDKTNFSLSIADFLKSRNLTPDLTAKSQGLLRTFNNDGNFSKLLSEIKKIAGPGNYDEIEGKAYESFLSRKADFAALSSAIDSQKDLLKLQIKASQDNQLITTFGGGKLLTQEQLSSIRSGVTSQLAERKKYTKGGALFLGRGGFYNPNDTQSLASEAVKVNTFNAGLAEKSLASIQNLDSLGLLGIQTDPNTKLGGASSMLRKLVKNRARNDFISLATSNQQQSTRAILGGYLDKVNSISKKETGVNAIGDRDLSSIYQDIGLSKYSSARDRLSNISNSFSEGNLKNIIEEAIQVLDVNSNIYDNMEEVATAFADKFVKNDSGTEIVTQLSNLNKTQEIAKNSLNTLKDYFEKKYTTEEQLVSKSIIDSQSLNISEIIGKIKSKEETLRQTTGSWAPSEKEKQAALQLLPESFGRELKDLRNQLRDAELIRNEAASKLPISYYSNGEYRQGSSEGDNYLKEVAKAVRLLTQGYQEVKTSLESIKKENTSSIVKVVQENLANLNVGIDVSQLLSAGSIREKISLAVVDVIRDTLSDNGFKIKTKPAK